MNLLRYYYGFLGAKEIVIALEKNSTLTSLNVGGNEIGPAGAKDIANTLEKNTALTSLDIRDNGIEDAGRSFS